MKALITFIAIALITTSIAVYPEFAKTYSSILTLNDEDQLKIPRMFHTTPLNASGSAQFSRKGLQEIIDVIKNENLIIVDLREEPHGFMGGAAISWYADQNWLNVGKTKETIIDEEIELLHNLSSKKITIIYKHRTYPVLTWVNRVMTEKELTTRHNVGYLRLPVRDHLRPSDEMVDEFVTFATQLPEGAWLHFHCHAGKGRTTTFLSMYDMMHNAKEAGFEEIITRQEVYGGTDLLKEPVEWKSTYHEDRMAFLQKFHQYCLENPHFKVKWTEWIKKHPLDANVSS